MQKKRIGFTEPAEQKTPASIGKAMSSGCIRMMNEDVIDLYDRVPAGTPVIVLPVPRAGA